VARYLVVDAIGGLGNRVRTLLSAAAAAESSGRRFRYVWGVSPSFAARFDDLWEEPFHRLPGQAGLALKAATRLHLPGVDRLEQDAPRATPAGGPVQFACTSQVFAGPDGVPVDWEPAFRDLRLRSGLADEVRAVHAASLGGTPYVGVQVRTNAAHRETVEASPLSWYLRRMEELRSERPDLVFFLSCDSRDAEAAIKERIPGVVTLADKGGYNSRRGIEAAVVDVYLLASAQRILAPHWSSFAEMAAALSPGIPYETSQRPWTISAEWEQPRVVADPVRPWARG
jgi:hypothetical protein